MQLGRVRGGMRAVGVAGVGEGGQRGAWTVRVMMGHLAVVWWGRL